MKLGKQLPIVVLKRVLLWKHLCTICMCLGFGERAGSDVSTGHVFLQCVLAAITLVRCGTRDARVRARVKCELGLILCLVASTTLLGVGSDPKLLEQKPWGSGLSWLHFLKFMLFPLPVVTLTPEGSSAGAREADMCSQHVSEHRMWWL